MESEIKNKLIGDVINLMSSNGLSKVFLFSLIDLGDGLDVDLESYPIVADAIEVIDGEVYIYDQSDEDENGKIELKYKLSDLPNGVIKDVRWVLSETLGIICKEEKE